MSFTTTNLANDRVLVRGTDFTGTTGEQVLDATQWNELTALDDFNGAKEAFDDAVEAFFKPLTDAAEVLNRDLTKPQDPASYVVLDQGQEHVPGRTAHVVQLSPDSIILRLIEAGDTDRLIWVDGVLEVLEYVPSEEEGPTLEEAQELAEQMLGATEVTDEG